MWTERKTLRTVKGSMQGHSLLCLVRHGSTAWNQAGRLQGRRDVPLTAAGVEEARRVGGALTKVIGELGYAKWSGVYASPLQRAHATAAEIARCLGLEVTIVDDLVERAFGVMEGLTRAEAEEAFPDWRRREHEVPGLEKEEALCTRALAVVNRLAAAHEGEAIVVVTHGGFINAFLRSLLDVDHSGGWALHNGGFTSVVKANGVWKVIDLNRSDHLGD